jgi:hypothetical protein
MRRDMIGQFGNVWRWQLATFLEDWRIIQAVTPCSCLFWNGLPNDLCLLDVFYLEMGVMRKYNSQCVLEFKTFHTLKLTCHKMSQQNCQSPRITPQRCPLNYIYCNARIPPKTNPRRPRGVVHINLAGVLSIPWSEITWAWTSELFHVSWISLGCSLLGMYPYLGSFIVVSFYGR